MYPDLRKIRILKYLSVFSLRIAKFLSILVATTTTNTVYNPARIRLDLVLLLLV